MLKEYREFIMRGNVIDMAVGIIIGAAFGTIVASLVNDIIMPPVGLLLGGVDFSNLFLLLKAGEPAGPYASLIDAQDAGAVTINYGIFINALTTFLIIAFVVFLLIRSLNRMTAQEEPEPEEPNVKSCPYCISEIQQAASRCPNCTSELEALRVAV